MRVYDQVAAVVKSGGKTRRAAKMQSIKVWHPDVMEFIECKWKEEKKAHVLIEKGGYESNFNGEAYSSHHVPERESFGSRDRRLHAGRRKGSGLDHALGDRRRRSRAPRTRPAT